MHGTMGQTRDCVTSQAGPDLVRRRLQSSGKAAHGSDRRRAIGQTLPQTGDGPSGSANGCCPRGVAADRCFGVADPDFRGRHQISLRRPGRDSTPCARSFRHAPRLSAGDRANDRATAPPIVATQAPSIPWLRFDSGVSVSPLGHRATARHVATNCPVQVRVWLMIVAPAFLHRRPPAS